MGDVKPSTRKRAVGTRERVLAYLASKGGVTDSSGMASTVLAEAVGYPGSSIAFAQLLSGMERSGLIHREVRGKRTYRIMPARRRAPSKAARQGKRQGKLRGSDPDAAVLSAGFAAPAVEAEARRDAGGPAGEVGAAFPPPGGVTGATGAAELDYDELARRLLVQVVRRLAAAGPNELAGRPGFSIPAGPGEAGAAPGRGGPHAAGEAGHPLEENALRETVAGLEQELASVRSRQRTLAEENEKLLERLREAQRSLAQVRERVGRPRITEQLGIAEETLLEGLLGLAGTPSLGEGAGTG